MYGQKKVKITGPAKTSPAAKKPAKTSPAANMAKMNKSAATGKPKAKLKPKSKMGMM
jgi:hypothetical protein